MPAAKVLHCHAREHSPPFDVIMADFSKSTLTA